MKEPSFHAWAPTFLASKVGGGAVDSNWTSSAASKSSPSQRLVRMGRTASG